MAVLTKKIISGHAYYYLRECQRVDGKPKIVWQKYLGSADQIIEKLTAPAPMSVSLREFGASRACFSLAQELRIAETVDRFCPKRRTDGLSVGEYILIATLNRCIAPRSKKRIASWYGKTILPRLLPAKQEQLVSQRFWENMERLEVEAIPKIEEEISRRVVDKFGLDLKCLLFDATNFFTFLDSFNPRSTLGQRGKSKEGRTKRSHAESPKNSRKSLRLGHTLSALRTPSSTNRKILTHSGFSRNYVVSWRGSNARMR